jgi:hypothetical protein
MEDGAGEGSSASWKAAGIDASRSLRLRSWIGSSWPHIGPSHRLLRLILVVCEPS